MRPVEGSIATTAPHFPCNSLCASACSPGLIVRTTLLPVTVAPRRRSNVERTIVSRFEFDAVRKSFYERSRPVWLRDWVE